MTSTPHEDREPRPSASPATSSATSAATSAPTSAPVPRYGLTEHWNATSIAFLLLSLIGLIGTFSYNVIAVLESRDYFGDWFGSGPAVNSMAVDLLVVAVAGSVLIVVEARRLRMKRAWLYIALSAVTAFAFTFPLFLAMRERRLTALSMP